MDWSINGGGSEGFGPGSSGPPSLGGGSSGPGELEGPLPSAAGTPPNIVEAKPPQNVNGIIRTTDMSISSRPYSTKPAPRLFFWTNITSPFVSFLMV